jgi:hypothetical protein
MNKPLLPFLIILAILILCTCGAAGNWKLILAAAGENAASVVFGACLQQ